MISNSVILGSNSFLISYVIVVKFSIIIWSTCTYRSYSVWLMFTSLNFDFAAIPVTKHCRGISYSLWQSSCLKRWGPNLKINYDLPFQCNLDYFHGQFNIGTCLHACGVATDLVLQQCLDRGASFVVCPCCYGNIQNTHLVTYPRSQRFREAGFSESVGVVWRNSLLLLKMECSFFLQCIPVHIS